MDFSKKFSVSQVYVRYPEKEAMYKAVYGLARVSVCFHPIFNFIRDRIIVRADITLWSSIFAGV